MKPWEQARAQAVTAAATLVDPNAGGALIASNTVTALASGPEANGIAVFLNGVVHYLTRFHWYDQRVLAFPTLLVLGVAIAIALDHDNLKLGAQHAINWIGQGWVNARALSPDPIIPSGGPA